MKFREGLSQETLTLLNKDRFSYDDVVQLLLLLRGENGCPWDRAQTHESIKSNAIEEAYELVDAIDHNSKEMMTEEIGDLLLQCVFHMQIGESENQFTATDVYTALCEKLISRHTHIFGSDSVNNSADALDNWEKNKIKEHKYDKVTEHMTAVPVGMASLMRAAKIQRRASKVGFDWDCIDGAIAKVAEELNEATEAIREAQAPHIEEELGDLLFSVVNLCRFSKVEPETALNKTTEKFIRRIQYVEQKLLDQNKQMSDASMDEMDKLWNEAKSKGL